MKAELTVFGPLLLGGMNFYGDPFSARGGWDAENEIGRTWQRFSAFLAGHPGRSYSANGNVMYEIHIYGEETESKGCFEVFVGEEVISADLPTALCAKRLPETECVRLTLSGGEISGDWCRALDAELLPPMGLTRDASFLVQAYDERFLGMDRIEDSVLVAYVPVKRTRA